jgi:murein DD-endopeptidase MepM/ murein hydrolase activator NlpD
MQLMKWIFIALAFLAPRFAPAQHALLFSAEKTRKGEAIYASNNAYCPVTLALDLQMDNAAFVYNKEPFFVIPARTQHYKLGEVTVYDWRQKWSYTYKVTSCYGDLRTAVYDSLYEYALPYQKDSAFRIVQGYSGSFSHQHQNALDFGMHEGTAVLAAREGIVIEVVQQFTEACLEDSCKKKGNYVTVYHSDGTMASYVHIRYNGAVVKPGDIVKPGDLIAYSGNTGYSSGPHLHFDCFLPNVGEKRTIPTKFIIGNGLPADYLAQGNVYRKDY